MRLQRIHRKATSVRTADRYFRLGADQARRLGQTYIGSEHVLLGLVSQRGGSAAVILGRLGITAERIEAEIRRAPGAPPPTAIDPQALATIGIDLDMVRAQIDERFGAGALDRTRRGCWPVEPSLKRALAHALETAGQRTPRDEHVLAGLAAVKPSGAVSVLGRLGLADDALQRALREL